MNGLFEGEFPYNEVLQKLSTQVGLCNGNCEDVGKQRGVVTSPAKTSQARVGYKPGLIDDQYLT